MILGLVGQSTKLEGDSGGSRTNTVSVELFLLRDLVYEPSVNISPEPQLLEIRYGSTSSF